MNKFISFLLLCVALCSCKDATKGNSANGESREEAGSKGALSGKEKREARIRVDSLLNVAQTRKADLLEVNDSTPILLNQALALALELNNDSLLASVYMELGLYFDAAAEYALEGDYYYQAIKYYEKIGFYRGAAMAYNNLSWGYIQAADYNKGIAKCRQGIQYLSKVQDENQRKRDSGFLYNNLSIAFLRIDQPDSALIYNEMALGCLPDPKQKELSLYSWILAQFGCIYAVTNDSVRAEEYFLKSMELIDSLNIADASVFAIGQYCHFLNNHGRYREAIHYGRDGIRIAMKANLNRFLIDLSDELRVSNEKLLRVDSAYYYAKMAMEFKDKVFNESKSIQLQSYSFNRDLDAKESQHEIETAKAAEKLNSEQKLRNLFLIGFIFVLLFAGLFLVQRNKIKAGKIRSDELLLNILPGEVAEELKSKGSAEAQLIDEVTVLFTDFKGFTQLSEKLNPKELVAEINECFSAFDHIMEKFGVEKIKTIGDAYMAAGGLPTSNTTHAYDVVNAALAIQKYMQEHKAKKESLGKLFFEIRIGVHSGPVVAGIVGVKKFSYDIWGDTVNIASRMESSSEVGKVNISGATYEKVKDQFKFSYRGKIQAKGIGEIDMYFVEERIL